MRKDIKTPNTIDPNTKIGRYILAKKAGANKKVAKEVAGYAPSTTSVDIEKTDTYKTISYKDELLAQITLAELAALSLRNAKNERDLGASNNAIKEIVNKIEPENAPAQEERVIVVLRNNAPILPETPKNASPQAPISPDNTTS